MPTFITTIEDFSPVVLYSGNGGNDWSAGTSSNDSSIDKYSDSSYMVTQVVNASVSFTFSGTGVQLYGAERVDHGLYQVTIDSHVYPPVNGQVNGTEEHFQTAIFQTAALKNGLHTVTIANLDTMKLDLDFITWETPIGQVNESLLSFTIQDSDSSFKYAPVSAWTTSPPNIGTFNGGSGHVTSTPGAFVDYTFKGKCAAVAIFGPVGPQGAPYSVQLDNGPTTNYSSMTPSYHPQTMLFQAGNLGSGAHTVRLSSEAWNNSALTFAVDYAQVFSTPSLQPRATFATGNIIAIIFGILLAFILIATSYLFYHHRRGTAVDSRTVFPFRRSGYRPLVYPSQGQPPTPHASIQPSSGWPTAGTAAVHSPKSINPEVFNALIASPPVISTPYITDRKYRPDIAPLPEVTSPRIEALSASSRHILQQNALLSSDSVQILHTTEQSESRQQIRVSRNGGVLPLEPSRRVPPEYVREQPQ